MRDEESSTGKKFAMLVGVGFDARHGHYRRTRGQNFLLVGGSEDTHRILQDRAISLNEELARRGRRLEDVEDINELRDIAHDAGW